MAESAGPAGPAVHQQEDDTHLNFEPDVLVFEHIVWEVLGELRITRETRDLLRKHEQVTARDICSLSTEAMTIHMNMPFLVAKKFKEQVIPAVVAKLRIQQSSPTARVKASVATGGGLIAPWVHAAIIPPIRVLMLTGKTILIPASTVFMLVESVKEQVFNQEGIPPDQQRLILAGTQLEDDQFVSAGQVLHLVLRLRAGCGYRFCIKRSITAGGTVTVTVRRVAAMMDPGGTEADQAIIAFVDAMSRGDFTQPAVAVEVFSDECIAAYMAPEADGDPSTPKPALRGAAVQGTTQVTIHSNDVQGIVSRDKFGPIAPRPELALRVDVTFVPAAPLAPGSRLRLDATNILATLAAQFTFQDAVWYARLAIARKAGENIDLVHYFDNN